MLAASIQDFLLPQLQLSLMLLFLVGWIGGGGWLLNRAMRKRVGRRKARLPRAMGAVTAAGVGGAFAGGIVFVFVRVIGDRLDVPLAIPGAILGGLTMIGAAVLVLYAMLGLSGKETLKAAGPALVFVLALAVLVVAVGGIPAVMIRRTRLRQEAARDQMRQLALAMDSFQRAQSQQESPLPENLKILVETERLAEGHLRSQGAPGKETGIFYHPIDPASIPENRTVPIACEFGPHHGGRAVLFVVNSDPLKFEPYWYETEQFNALLAEPDNKAFAEAFAEAGGTR